MIKNSNLDYLRTTIDLIETLSTADKLLGAYIKLGLAEDRTGGYFCISHLADNALLLLIRLGTPLIKWEEFNISRTLEKSRRLFLNIKDGHLTSFESENHQRLEFGGAIKTKDFIFSFHGLPILGNEALMLALAKRLNQIDLNLPKDIKHKKYVNNIDLQINDFYLRDRKNENFEKLNAEI